MKTSRHPLRRRSRAARAAGALLVLLLELGVFTKPLTAGDILRGGATSGAPVGASNPVGTAPPAITPNGGTTRDSLARTAMAIQAMQAMQQSARNLANQGANHVATKPSGSVLPDVPDGLGKGGLQVDPRVTGQANDPLWTGAGAPVQSTKSGGGTQVTITQTAQQAVLNWETFNVGKNTTLTFDQSTNGGANVGQWIAFNKVNDPTANPTQILGSIQAQGQVYIINRNGIIFGGSSQVNVHTLVASSLSINDDLVKQGLLNNPSNTFLFSGIGGDASTKVGDVVVEAGAQLTAPTSAEKVGGRIALIGANVVNDGTISTTDGQTILAAGLEVGWAAHASSDPSLRGLDTFVGAVVDPASTLTAYAGTVTNSGIVDAGRADVTMVGKNVAQLGAITSTTSVSFNGRIDLLANYDALSNPGASTTLGASDFVNNSTGTVTLGEGSVTQILPELSSTETVIGSTLALRSQINIQGQQIHFANNSLLYAPNAIVTVDAGTWNAAAPNGSGSATYEFFHNSGQINVDDGSMIDVSGSKDVKSSVTSNIVKVELRGSELADSPLLRDGALRGQTIYVDITESGTYNGKTWVGTPLADVSGYVNLVQRTVGELTAAGGTVNLNAGGAVVIRNGATVDVSGGTIDYAGAVVQTSRVFAGKQVFDVADATPDRVYDGVYKGGSISTSKAWGVTEQYTNPLTLNGTRYQDGYTQGGNGGTLNITGGSAAVDGSLKGSTYTGVRQRTIGPVASSLNISLTAQRILPGQTASSYSPNSTGIVFSNTNTQQPLADYAVDSNGNPLDLPQERIDKLILSPDLLGDSGFGNLSVKSPDGNITVEKGVTLQTAPRGSISLAGANIDIEGSLVSAGGTLSFTTYDISPDTVAELHVTNGSLPAFDPTRGQFTLGTSATLNTAGYLVDDRPTSNTLLQTPLVTTGGAVTINSLSADLSAGSLIDVSGGVVATGGGKYTWGNAGKISIQTGRDPAIGGIRGGHLTLDGQLQGMSGAKGGSLTLQASTVQIGGDSAPEGTLHLSTDFFNQGGFSSITVNGVGTDGNVPALLVAAGTQLAPVTRSWLASEVNGAISLSTFVQDEGLRTPLNLSFGAAGVSDALLNQSIAIGDVKVETGATINAGIAGSITLNGQTDEINGSLLAAGGTVVIASATYPQLFGATETEAHTTVMIGADAVISTAGVTVLVPDSFGRQRGAVLGGGSINISGNIVAEKGALLDVSGTSGVLDLLPGESGQSLADLPYGASGTTSRPYNIRGKSTRVDSDGGTIKLTGTQMLLTDATLAGDAGGSSAAGGTLDISSGAFILSGSAFPQDPNIVLVQSGPVISSTYTAGIGQAAQIDSSGIVGGGRFAIDSFSSGGFDNLDISGVIKSIGPVAIKADGRVTLGTGPVLYSDSTLSVNASYVKIGAPFKTPRQSQDNQDDYLTTVGTTTPIRMPATHGTGTLSISGDLIDVGDLSLQGIGSASLVANNGDIRGSGTLAVAGDLSLTAGQIYPPTALQFTLAAFDYQSGGITHAGSVTITGSGKRSLPLSGGGTLAVYATNIVQDGTLRAPFGNIILGWDGTGAAPFDHLTGANAPKTASLTLGSNSVTSVSAIDPITGKGVVIPYGTSVDGTTWLDPAGNDVTNGGLPQKSVTLSGDSVVSEKGSQVDIRGGGDLFAYRFVAGNGGSTDILASSGSFAILPGYSADYAPYAPYSNHPSAAALAGDAGYINSGLQVGQQVYLDGSTGVPAGVYTLLPARYALLPGAYLVTPQSGAAIGTVPKADGSKLVSGYLLNGLDDSVGTPAVRTRFEIASAKVVNSRAEYTQFLANSFLTSTGGFRLPGDSGQLVLSATKAMAIGGQVLSAASGDFRGGLIDISSAGDILITNGTPASSPAGTLVIDVNLLSGFGAESLLIGGVRSAESDGTLVTVTTGNITLDNAGAALTGPEIILAAKEDVTLAAGAQIKQSGKASNTADTLIIGNTLATGATPTGSGNGSLVRVSHGDGGSLIRRDVIPGQGAVVSIGSGASLKGDSVTLDSTATTLIGTGADLSADNLSLSSGRISLSLDPGVTPGADAGLVLSSDIIRELASSSSLSLSSYSSIDLLGAGVVGGVDSVGKPAIDSLSLHAAAIRGIGVGSGSVEFDAGQIEIGGLDGSVAPTGPAESGGLLSFRSTNLRLGSGAVDLRGFGQVDMTATKEVRTTANGNLSATGGLTLNTPLLTSDATVKYAITSAGALQVTGSGSTGAVATAGLASSLSLTGSSVDLSSRIVLPSGSIRATATSGDLNVGGSLEAGGISQRFKTQTRYTDGGAISLTASAGDITLAAGGSLDVSAEAGGGDAGSVTLSAKSGSVDLAGTINGKGSTSGKNGSFALQVASLPSLAAYDALLDAASFTEAREYRVTNGDVAVDGIAHAHSYTVSTDSGSIRVSGSIDASGAEGGTVRLVANQNLTLANGSSIDASGADFNSAGQGGSVTLETRGASGGMLDLEQGSTIDLSIAKDKGAASAKAGDFTGVLHLRAPQISNGTDIAVGSLSSTVTGASEVIVEGYQIYDLTSSGGAITTAVQNQVKTGATAFMGNANTIESRILAGSSSNLGSVLTVRPGAEIVNTTGDLTLGSATSTSTSDWDLSTYRFGGEQVPGILTLRAAGNLVFYNTLSDGFTSSVYTAGLMANNAALGDNAESWSFRLVSGADFSAADTRKVIPVTVADDAALGSASGSVKLGKDAGFYASSRGASAVTSDALNKYFQVIRTGSGDIDVVAAGDVQLLNQFASIYTGGTQTSDPTLGGTFVNPVTRLLGGLGGLGAIQQSSQAPIQYSLGGGDVSLTAGNDIIHLTLYADPDTGITGYVQDSQREMPDNWLYRRGYVNPATGQFGTTRNGDVASTTWWVDFTNFFDGVAALGGGNVTLTAGRDVSNVDASTPTNARMPGGTPDASKLVELGGGDVTVIAGRNINAGVYYVERGEGSLTAGSSIVTNSTRAPSLGGVAPNEIVPLDPSTWLPTTLFVGKSAFDVTAGDDALLGPVANPFLLPQGLNNSPYNKSWFSTYSQDAGVTVTSYGGDVTLRQAVTLPGSPSSESTLHAWFSTQLLLDTSAASTSSFQPWLRLTETNVDPFNYAFTLMPGTLKMTSFSGDVNVAGSVTLSPSATGTLEILAANAVNGLQPTGVNLLGNRSWVPAVINLSDADPSALPGITTPFAYQQLVGTTGNGALSTQTGFLLTYESLFAETGSTDGALQERQVRHSLVNGQLLHANDTQPVRIYSDSGDISGLTLFSAKSTEILAGQDLRDISFYIQNVRATDVSIVSASRDIIAYDLGTSSRVTSQSAGNELFGTLTPVGDIQIAGQGTLEVFAGRNLDLGIGQTNSDGTGSGITSIGNGRNPYLTFAGADIITAAGFDATSLTGSKADFAAFVTQFVNTDDGAAHLKELGLTPEQFAALNSEAQSEAALKVFFLVLRDTGRDHNNPDNENFGTYKDGLAAIATLFPGTGWKGDIDTRSRNIRTRNGGDITLFAPGGSLRLAQTVIGSPLVPPGIITEAGGNINIATDEDVNLGISRIFTLRGGNEVIWSTHGDIAAGSSSKTIQSAPPTRVLIDPQSGDVKTDLAGLATGGGIGVLSTVAGVKAADVDLIAPEGTIDAGDAGIRVTGNITLAGAVIANGGNITAGGTSSGVSTGPSAPSVSALTAASSAAVAATTAETNPSQQNPTPGPQPAVVDTPSVISVEVVGYGGDDEDSNISGGSSSDDEEEKRRRRQQEQQQQQDESGQPGEATQAPGH